MARWRLMQPHYLNVPGTEWEYKETDRSSGKQGRKLFPVPMYLRPDDPADHNYPGEIVVFQEGSEGKQGPRDIVFVGEPTPDMEPLDDEAQAISERFAPNWQHPIETLDGGFSQSLLTDFQRQFADALAKNPIQVVANPVSAGNISPEQFAQMQEQMAQVLAQNAEMKAKLEMIEGNAVQPTAGEAARRKV